MKKILIVVTKAEMGGAQNSIINLVKGLKKGGFDITVGSGEGDYLKLNLENLEINHYVFKSLKRSINPFKNLFFIFEIRKYIEKEKIAVVHFNSSNSLFGAIGAKFTTNKPKTVFTFHGLSVLDPNYKANTLFKLFYKSIFKFLLLFIDQSVFVSHSNLEYAQKNNIVKHGIVIYNGLDLKDSDFLNKEKAQNFLEAKLQDPKKFSFSKENFIIGSIGRLAYPKNYEFLINVFPEILKIRPDAIGIIIGEGPERSKY